MIYLVRHGETSWNAENRQQGRLDSPLTPKGGEQAQALGRTLSRLIVAGQALCIESSPLGRAKATAAIISAELRVNPQSIAIAPLLIEHDLGEWQGLTWEEIERKDPGARSAREANKWHYTAPGGESYQLIAERARQWLAITRFAPVTVAVTHEMLSRTIQGVYIGLSPSEMLRRSHPHERIYRLHDGRIEDIVC